MNKVILIGNLAADPEYRTTQSGVACCTMRLAVQRRYANADGKREADFFNIVTWRQTADFCSRYLSKGRRIAVEGSLQNRSYDAQDGSKRYVTEVIAENVEFCDNADSARAPKPQTQAAPSAPAPSNGGFTEVDDDELPF